MEEESNLWSRSNEARSLFKKCFKNCNFSLVPFEVWRDLIVFNSNLDSITILAQTCFAFRKLVAVLNESYLRMALSKRIESEIPIASKYLERASELGNVDAMFHLGYAQSYNGWGFKRPKKLSEGWFEKGARRKHGASMAFYAYVLRYGDRCDVDLSNSWASKAVDSEDNLAVGICFYFGLKNTADREKTIASFEASALEGNEYGESWYAFCFKYGYCEFDDEKSLYWYSKAAEQGLCEAQYRAATILRKHGKIEMAKAWFRKAALQNDKSSKGALDDMGVDWRVSTSLTKK